MQKGCKNEDLAWNYPKTESINNICCIQQTHLKKDKTFRMRSYQCIRTDRAGDRNKGGVLTLVMSNISAYLSGSSTDSAEYQVVKIETKTKEIHLVNYYCKNNVNIDLLNIPVVRPNFIIVRDFNSHSRSWGYNHSYETSPGTKIEEWQDDNNLIPINKHT